MFPEPTELLLIRCLKDQFGLQDPKQVHRHEKQSCRHANQGKFDTRRTESSFVFVQHWPFQFCQFVLKRWHKEIQQDSGEERVTAKSRPMMSLVARAPSALLSSASESQGKRSYGNQDPWSAKSEREDRKEQPVVDRDVYSARYSRWDDDKAWSSPEWNADKLWMVERCDPLCMLKEKQGHSNSSL